MSRRVRRTLGGVFAALAMSAAVAAESTEVPDKPDPQAIAALTRMATYLRTLKVFSVHASTTQEEVLDDGLKISYAGESDVLAQMPNRLRADVANDRFERMYLYDGKNFTLYAKRSDYYATVPAPATIALLDDKLNDDYGINVPLIDLFRWGAQDHETNDIVLAVDVGPGVVERTTCEQYAFRQEGVDWQLWIQKGDYPLPRKLVITTTTDPSRPQHTVVYTWNLAPSFNEAAFTFRPPEGAGKVPLESIQRIHPANQ